MILYGQYDSPFVRRVAVALEHYRLPFDHRPWSVFADFEAMLTVNPLGKVPVLETAEGVRLCDSRAIIEYLEGLAPADRSLVPGDPADRLCMLAIEAVGIGLAEKIYERGVELSRKTCRSRDMDWVSRLERQILSALAWLDERAGNGWMVGTSISRADLATVVAATYLAGKRPALVELDAYPRLAALRGRGEAAAPFAAIRPG